MPTATLGSSSAALSLHAGNGLNRESLHRSTSTRSEVTTNNLSTARVLVSTASVGDSALATAQSSLPSESSSSSGGAAVVGSGCGVSSALHQPTAGITLLYM